MCQFSLQKRARTKYKAGCRWILVILVKRKKSFFMVDCTKFLPKVKKKNYPICLMKTEAFENFDTFSVLRLKVNT